MAACMMRQSDEKHILGTAATEILLWSSRRDLIAVSNSYGEVFLRRLSWNKVWKLAKRGDNIKVTSIVWRPDSQVLAVGYSSGHVVLVDVESGETLHTFNPCGEAVTCLSWESNPLTVDDETIHSLMPKLLPLPLKVNTPGTAETEKQIKHEKNFSLLWIGLKNSMLYGYTFGMFPCCVLHLTKLTGGCETIGPVRHIRPSHDHSQLTVLVDLCGRPENLLMSVETPLVGHCLRELYILGVLYRQISGLIDCLTNAQKSLHEAWEDALVDLESKMVRYESNEGESSLSVDLMELLMFGHAGLKLERFLVTELTDKGLKRIGQAVELSYSNMQKLLVKNIMCANYQLSHYLTQLCGLIKQEGLNKQHGSSGINKQGDKFSLLGLELNCCLAAYRAAGSFTAKTIELQQVIDGSVKYLKTFLRWLYVTILRLSDEPIPPELGSSTQQDVRFIANFLAKDFETDGQVRLDRIGQYLRNEPLSFTTSSKNRPWDMLVEACPSLSLLKETEMFQPHAENSLTQEFAQLETKVKTAFANIPSTIGQSALLPFNIGIGVDCPAENLHQIRVTSHTFINCKDRCTLLTLTNSPAPAKGFYLFEFADENEKNKPRAAFFHFGTSIHLPPDKDIYLSDIQFYNNEILSVLLSCGGDSSIFLQLCVNLLREELVPVVSRRGFISPDFAFVPSVLHPSNVRSVDASAYIEPTSFRLFQDFQASSMGLSSSRKVAAIFSSVKKKIRIFDMEVEEEEEEEEEEVEDDDDDDIDEQPSNISYRSSKDKRNDSELNDTDMAISP